MFSECVDTDETSEESSSKDETPEYNFKITLDEFRQKWHQELNINASGSDSLVHKLDDFREEKSEASSNELKAAQLFLQGVEYERRGKVYDALSFYRRAIQIVPDIEFRIYESAKTNIQPNEKSSVDKTIEKFVEFDDSDVDWNADLAFQASLQKSGACIQRMINLKEGIKPEAHMSDLPMELILYLFRWIVSSHLDLKSLESCSAVCKGFYICARDDEIWRHACLKVWGLNTGVLENSVYLSWRQMFIERYRIHFNGCYISKTSYLRYGENSFQDQFYRPVQLIEYYRYIRFQSDGTVGMMISADEPAQCVNKLKNLNLSRPDILKGHYRLHDDMVIIVLTKNQKISSSQRRRVNVVDPDLNNKFYIELKIMNTKRRFCKLQWEQYSIIQIKNKREIPTEFEITSAKYPSLWFSRVKSYASESEGPLQ